MVIYRDLQSKIVHTGLVVGILSDGSVMVESKWSVGCRFLHRPEDQPYSTVFAYYRTSRRNHTLAIRAQTQPYVAERNRTIQEPTEQESMAIPTATAFVTGAG